MHSPFPFSMSLHFHLPPLYFSLLGSAPPLRSLAEFRTGLRFPGHLGWWSPLPQGLGRPPGLPLEESMGNNMHKKQTKKKISWRLCILSCSKVVRHSSQQGNKSVFRLQKEKIMRILRKELQHPVITQCQAWYEIISKFEASHQTSVRVAWFIAVKLVIMSWETCLWLKRKSATAAM